MTNVGSVKVVVDSTPGSYLKVDTRHGPIGIMTLDGQPIAGFSDPRAALAFGLAQMLAQAVEGLVQLHESQEQKSKLFVQVENGRKALKLWEAALKGREPKKPGLIQPATVLPLGKLVLPLGKLVKP